MTSKWRLNRVYVWTCVGPQRNPDGRSFADNDFRPLQDRITLRAAKVGPGILKFVSFL